MGSDTDITGFTCKQWIIFFWRLWTNIRLIFHKQEIAIKGFRNCLYGFVLMVLAMRDQVIGVLRRRTWTNLKLPQIRNTAWLRAQLRAQLQTASSIVMETKPLARLMLHQQRFADFHRDSMDG